MMSFDETFSMFVAAAKAKGVDVGPHGGYQIFAEVGYERLADMTARATDLEAQNTALIAALDAAATSLETINLRSFGEDSGLDSKAEMRSYAGSRASVARNALVKAKGGAA